MRPWPWSRRKAAPDPDVMLRELARANGLGRSDFARYRDFRDLFMGSALGKRVLHDIFAWSHMFEPAFRPGDPYATHFRDGERNIGLRILTVLNAAPSDQAAQAELEPDGRDLKVQS